MLNSTTFNNTTFPFLYDDDNNNIALSYINNNNDEINPFSYYDQIQSPLNYYNMEDYCEFLRNHELAMVLDPLQATNSSVVTDDSSVIEVATTKMDSNKGDEASEIMVNKTSTSREPKRRRTSNKDRHSKIRTANGLRDRRMRLSLEVARRFFKLQDLLGYDKASTTVEWLLTRSQDAIDEVFQSKNDIVVSDVTKCTITSNSDCEGESIINEQNKGSNNNNKDTNKGKKTMASVAKDGKNKEKRLRTTKEAMKVARDKARKRTLEKMQSRGIKDHGVNNFHHLAFGACDEMMMTINHIKRVK